MLPHSFLSRMEGLLRDEYPAFLRAMTEGKAEHAFRVNTVKLSVAAFEALSPLGAGRVPYTPDGFYHDEEKIGRHPYHHAGMVYSQDPGAMSALQAVEIQPGWRVLDVCAAPGGKSAQIAAAIGGEGVLVSNEYVSSRAKLLVGNIERLGIPNALVLNTDSATLRGQFPGYFDMVVVDAPCSGEGMFRKSEDARRMWSEENVQHCAERQKEILADAAETVRAGGYLLYSTCTFAPEENEEQVAAFLAAHPDFSLCPVRESLLPYTAAGLSIDGIDPAACRRFYPHIAPGEGQFMALLQKSGDPCGRPAPAYRDAGETPTKADLSTLRAFFADALGDDTYAAEVRSLHGNLVLPPDIPLPPRGVFAAGVLVGEVRKGILFPHHQLFSAYGKRFVHRLNLALDDPRVSAYLHGDVIPAPELSNGYCAVLLEGCPLGGAKIVDGMAKNLYPKGLRQ